MFLCTILRSITKTLLGTRPEPGGAPPELGPRSGPRRRVAILGGGPAGVATAFWLSHPEFHGTYDVTLYQLGWRLGGKCASGRDMTSDGNKVIKEHGLHILMGCYQHAFFAIRDCYKDWQPRPESPIQRFNDAFTRLSEVTLLENDSDPQLWEPWPVGRPQDSRLPGDREPGQLWPEIPDVFDFLGLFSEILKSDLVSYADAKVSVMDSKVMASEQILDTFKSVDAALHSQVQRLDDYAAAHRQLDTLHKEIKADLARSETEDGAGERRRRLILMEIGFTVIKGALRDVCAPGAAGIDSLDQQEFRSWMRGHGASERALNSAPIRLLYDLMFAYRGGEVGSRAARSSMQSADVAAGVALQFVMEAVVGYRGALLWRMNAGMGDTIFTPFYQVLKARNVKINLFHRVTGISLTRDRRKVGRVTLDRQAVPEQGEYEPFVEVGGLDCWPDRPLWKQLRNGRNLERSGVNLESNSPTRTGSPVTLDAGRDFDLVVLALPPDVIKQVAPDLALDHAWSKALSSSRSVVTESLQLWLRDPIETLGGARDTIASAFEPPFSSWAEMSHLLEREDWKDSERPKGLAYFCGCVPDTRARIDPVADADRWMSQHLADMWRGVRRGAKGPSNNLATRYERANTDASDRYVQTPAGSVQHRLDPGKVYFENLFVTGDWTKTRFSGGCVESAFESGLRAARAISDLPIPAGGQPPERVRRPVAAQRQAGPGARPRQPAPLVRKEQQEVRAPEEVEDRAGRGGRRDTAMGQARARNAPIRGEARAPTAGEDAARRDRRGGAEMRDAQPQPARATVPGGEDSERQPESALQEWRFASPPRRHHAPPATPRPGDPEAINSPPRKAR